MAAKKKKPKVELEFLEMVPLDEEEDEDEELDEELEEDELDMEVDDEAEDDGLDEELMSLAEVILGDGDMATRAQALKDFVHTCTSLDETGDGY